MAFGKTIDDSRWIDIRTTHRWLSMDSLEQSGLRLRASTADFTSGPGGFSLRIL